MEQQVESLPTNKPGRKPKEKGPTVEELQLQIDNLTKAFEKMATFTGNGNMLLEFGLKRWIPGKQDLTKYKG